MILTLKRGKSWGLKMDKPLNLLDLFSGIGGFSLGLERSKGFKTVAFCEIEQYPCKVLANHWPEVPIYNDVRTLTREQLTSDGIRVDAICGAKLFSHDELVGVGIDGDDPSCLGEYRALYYAQAYAAHAKYGNRIAGRYLGCARHSANARGNTATQ